MAAGNVNRSEDRTVQVAFRLSHADREELRRRVAASGLSVQAYLEWKALDRPDATDRPPGRPPSHPELFHMTG